MKPERREYTRQFYRGNHLWFLLALLATLLAAAQNLWITWLLQQLLDAASGVPDALSLRTLAQNVAGVLLSIFAVNALRYASKPRFFRRAMGQYKAYAFQKLTRKSISAFQAESTANYISAFSNDAAAMEAGYLEMQFSLASGAVRLFGALLMMLWYSPLMTLVACGFFLLPIGVSYLTGNPMARAEEAVSEKNSGLVAALKDALGGFSVIKSFQAEAAISQLFAQSSAALEQAKCRRRKVLTVISSLSAAAAVAAQLGTFLVGILLALRGRGITPGILVAFIDLTGLVIGPIRELPEQLASRKAALALMDKLAAALENHVREEGISIPNRLEAGITLENVHFAYEDGKPVLHHINTTFEAGKKYAIVGASGSGKSTLLQLLMAGHTSYGGSIRYDEQEVKTISGESLYDLTSMIQQNVFVFNATVRDNITLFRPFPEEDIRRAIQLSGLSPLIGEKGAEYLCGENGSGLSGGEKQRIAIARSLLKQSRVLLVDEATAALDRETAHQVSSAIMGLADVTCIVVTHALDAALLRRYDGILALKNGTIVESGTFDALLAKKGYFYSLFTLAQ